MKANEFFKAYGFDEVRYLVSLAANARVCCIDGEHIHVNDLKRLVKSYELVESCGGLENAKKELQRQSILRWINPETERLRVAIADVESCQ